MQGNRIGNHKGSTFVLVIAVGSLLGMGGARASALVDTRGVIAPTTNQAAPVAYVPLSFGLDDEVDWDHGCMVEGWVAQGLSHKKPNPRLASSLAPFTGGGQTRTSFEVDQPLSLRAA